MSLSSTAGLSAPDLDFIGEALRAEGFRHFGFARLEKPFSIGLYEEWLRRGHQGDMAYLERHLPEKRAPEKLLARARSAIVVTLDYVPHPESIPNFPLSHATRIAAYARGRDYHHFLKKRLAIVTDALKMRWATEEFAIFSDSSPVLERDLAARAGLGWVGKNTCLLDRKHGSLFFLAEIYTSLELPGNRSDVEATLEIHDHCGTCTRCLDACPTGALKAPRELDARLCISYLTIESRGVPENALREKMGDWFFGCDACQTVCPWNLKVHGRQTIEALSPGHDSGEGSGDDGVEALINDLRFILTSSNRALERAFHGTALSRAEGVGLKRNALIVAANRKLKVLRPEIKALATSEKLTELVAWALARLDSVES